MRGECTMKREYEAPEMEIIHLSVPSEIITTSGIEVPGGEGEGW